MARNQSSGSTQTINLRCHDEVAFGQTVNFVSPQCDLCFAPRQENIGVMAFFLGNGSNPIHKVQRLFEIRESELAIEMMLVNDDPVGNAIM